MSPVTFSPASPGAVIAIVVLVLAILFAVLGRMDPILAGFIGALALCRLI